MIDWYGFEPKSPDEETQIELLLKKFNEAELVSPSLADAIHLIGRAIKINAHPTNDIDAGKILNQEGFDNKGLLLIAVGKNGGVELLNLPKFMKPGSYLEGEIHYYVLPIQIYNLLPKVLSRLRASKTSLGRLRDYQYVSAYNPDRHLTDAYIRAFNKHFDAVDEGKVALCVVVDSMESLLANDSSVDKASVIKALLSRLPSEEEYQKSVNERRAILTQMQKDDLEEEKLLFERIKNLASDPNIEEEAMLLLVGLFEKYKDVVIHGKSFRLDEALADKWGDPSTFAEFRSRDEATGVFSAEVTKRMSDIVERKDALPNLVRLLSLWREISLSKKSITDWINRGNLETLVQDLGPGTAAYLWWWAKELRDQDFANFQTRWNDSLISGASNWVEYIYMRKLNLEIGDELRVNLDNRVARKGSIYGDPQLIISMLDEVFQIRIDEVQLESYVREVES
ncbi:MAG: hypothetical protein JNK26_04875 [Candidatus Doudnabacteria bacterium]|nr:hypothetical protein [Candidatus Doudnabacteria bacterium]